ncbi:MAG: FHA domain-containing protein [Methanomicrobiales archaeon]
MSQNKNLTIILTLIIVLLILILVFINEFIDWINLNWLDLIFAIIIALVFGILVKLLYNKYSARSKVLKTTVTPPTKKRESLAKLILNEKQEFLIKEYERVFGREDFLGVVLADNLMYIGKKHFKITREDDGFYIEDLNTKNGTVLNGEDIRGRGQKKLKNGDEIIISKVLNIKYVEKNF